MKVSRRLTGNLEEPGMAVSVAQVVGVVVVGRCCIAVVRSEEG